MRCKDDGFTIQKLLDTIVEEVTANVYINSWQYVIKQVDVAVAVNCARKTHSLLLSPTQICTPVTYLWKVRKLNSWNPR